MADSYSWYGPSLGRSQHDYRSTFSGSYGYQSPSPSSPSYAHNHGSSEREALRRPQLRAHFQHPSIAFSPRYTSDGQYATASYDTRSGAVYEPAPEYPSPPHEPHQLTNHKRRGSYSLPRRPQTTRPTSSSYKKQGPPYPKATEADSQTQNIPAGYSIKNWDPTEDPVILFDTEFDANSIGKWVYWSTLIDNPMNSAIAGELWLQLIELAGNKRNQIPRDHIAKRVHTMEDRDAVSKTNFSKGDTDYHIEGEINGIRVIALPDTGAERSAVSPEFAKLHNLSIIPNPDKESRIILANGCSIWSPGKVHLPWNFIGESHTYEIECDIIPGSKQGLILDSNFLSATDTLTKHFSDRIKKISRQNQQCRKLKFLGNHKQRIWGSINDNPVTATPDTGSDVMLVSDKFAQACGFFVDTSIEHQVELELSDGSTAWTNGVIRGLEWKFENGTTVTSDFHVLNNLPVEIILSNEFLFHFNVFSRFEHDLVCIPSAIDLSELLNIRLIGHGRYSKALDTLENQYLQDLSCFDTFSPEKVQLELARRDNIRGAISKLSEPLQEQAWKDEHERQRLYNEVRKSYHTQKQSDSPQVMQTQDSASMDVTIAKKMRRFLMRTQKLRNLN